MTDSEVLLFHMLAGLLLRPHHYPHFFPETHMFLEKICFISVNYRPLPEKVYKYSF